jgi:hypothetical protein
MADVPYNLKSETVTGWQPSLGGTGIPPVVSGLLSIIGRPETVAARILFHRIRHPTTTMSGASSNQNRLKPPETG